MKNVDKVIINPMSLGPMFNNDHRMLILHRLATTCNHSRIACTKHFSSCYVIMQCCSWTARCNTVKYLLRRSPIHTSSCLHASKIPLLGSFLRCLFYILIKMYGNLTLVHCLTKWCPKAKQGPLNVKCPQKNLSIWWILCLL